VKRLTFWFLLAAAAACMALGPTGPIIGGPCGGGYKPQPVVPDSLAQ